ncbi:ZZ-type zinc finger-containing protein 3 [Psilocybe cubensis]|uniref:Myb-like domain-containing protein n=2 Tax=Psilocybe cubensis TaxID=181762 RepID=A0A8H7XTZ3_PSICU|nr:ZZ-type zinc finger-containing protein 3 [Psilocybe cubensis]KAH9474544.1 ZZ-type zinc finger-containing protein 3 [Psilocybe cubensis]
MDEQNHAQTLQALEVFISTQRTLLAQQRADIERLQRLKVDIVQRPSHFLSNLSNELDDNAFRLSEQASCRLTLPKDIDWAVFEKSGTFPFLAILQNFIERSTDRTQPTDTGPLRTLAQCKRDEIASRAQPSQTQRPSSLSDLQRFVKRSRRTILDPILARFAAMSPEPESSSEEELDPIERQRRLEQQKIRELKQRKIRGGCALRMPLSSKAGSMGVFIREDVAEEAMALDVSIDDDDGEKGTITATPQFDVEMDASDGEVPLPPPMGKQLPIPPKIKKVSSSSASTRVHRGGKKNLPPPPVFDDDDDDDDISPFAPLPDNPPAPRKKTKPKALAKTKRKKNDFEDGSEDDDYYGADPAEEIKTKSKARGNGKPKPETYKQAWSESEQNLLEQLLEQIPEGEKFRWQKISRAMGGRRTPRQVASRVQKYFEKLKKFGLMIDGD